MGEGTGRSTWREPHAGVSRPVRTAPSSKTGLKWLWKEPVDLSTMSNGSALRAGSDARQQFCQRRKAGQESLFASSGDPEGMRVAALLARAIGVLDGGLR